MVFFVLSGLFYLNADRFHLFSFLFFAFFHVSVSFSLHFDHKCCTTNEKRKPLTNDDNNNRNNDTLNKWPLSRLSRLCFGSRFLWFSFVPCFDTFAGGWQRGKNVSPRSRHFSKSADNHFFFFSVRMFMISQAIVIACICLQIKIVGYGKRSCWCVCVEYDIV